MDMEVLQQMAVYWFGAIILGLLVEFLRALIWGTVFYIVLRRVMRGK